MDSAACASSDGHADVTHMLAEHGADVSAQAKRRAASAVLGVCQGSCGCGTGTVPVQCGVDGSTQGPNGWTLLHGASYYGHVDLVWMLLERGADVSAQTEDGWTPLHWASSMDHANVTRILVERSVNMLAQDKDGWTLLHWC